MKVKEGKKMFTIGNKEFSSKKGVEDYCKDLLKTEIKSDELFYFFKDTELFLLELLKLHPRFSEKIPNPSLLENIVLRRNKIDGKSNQFCYVLKDSKPEPFSYKKCIYQTNYNRNVILEIFRNLILDQVNKYKVNRCKDVVELQCDLTHIPFPVDELEVDHFVPLSCLIDNFLKEKNINISDIEIDFADNKNSIYNHFKNKSLEKDFQDYHRKNAKLNLIHKKLNAKLSNKPKDGKEFLKIVEEFKKEYS